MRILRIALKNLNSLRGEHVVDLRAEPLASAGLFAITGPTGAGKSTLLDAVTLALYGRAARYPSTPSPADMMSRHCGECIAEVVFSVPAGIYRAEWQLRKARGKADGNLQQPNRYVYDASGNVLAEKIREADEKIEQLVGLDYERFLRSVLLAQGEFARFLKARHDERAMLLESLTGAVIYAELGKLVHTETTRRENELANHQIGLNQIELLSQEQRTSIGDDIARSMAARQDLEGRLVANAELLAKVETLAEALNQEVAAVRQQQEVEAERVEAEADLQALDRHRHTLPFQEQLARLDSAEEALSRATERRSEAEEEHADAALLVGEARSLYRRVLSQVAAKHGTAQENARRQLLAATEARESAEAWLAIHTADAALDSVLPGLAELVGDLKSSRRMLAQEWAKLRSVATEFSEELSAELPSMSEGLGEHDLEVCLRDFLECLGRAQEQVGAHREVAESTFRLREHHLQSAQLVAQFEDHRASLKDGEPCPLCGATKHPYAVDVSGGVAFADLERALAEARTDLGRINEEAIWAEQRQADCGETCSRLRQLFAECADLAIRLADALQPFDVAPPAAGEEDLVNQALQERHRAYQEHLRNRDTASGEERAARQTLEHETSWLNELEPKLDLVGGPEPHVPDLADGDEDLDHFSLSEVEGDWATKERTWNTASTVLVERRREEMAAAEQFRVVRETLQRTLEGSTFSDLEELRSARLDLSEVERIDGIRLDLEGRGNDANARLRHAQGRIGTLREALVPEEEAADGLREQQADLQERRDTLIRDLTTWENQLREDETRKRQAAETENRIAAAREELVVWKRLQGLIGSHDGAKFRRYAQAISLDILVRHANQHLIRLSDRYRIRRGQGEELQLEIEDLHQTGATRPMSSLSGGESFLASLALALGLSKLAGRKVQIESLFIDEGFGSLDSETLDLAIGTLEGLRQDNKSVGVISHVELLKQRITTQIVVEKRAGGTSMLRIVP